jgi:hypothetical protein
MGGRNRGSLLGIVTNAELADRKIRICVNQCVEVLWLPKVTYQRDAARFAPPNFANGIVERGTLNVEGGQYRPT